MLRTPQLVFFQTAFFDAVLAIAFVMLFSFALSWSFALIGLVVKNIESVEIASFTPIRLTLAASTFVPVQDMPGWLQAFAKAQPITHVVNATRTLTQGARPPTKLEAANLVATVRHGREKLHYLNAAPINDIAQRWINRYDQGRVHALSDLKQTQRRPRCKSLRSSTRRT